MQVRIIGGDTDRSQSARTRWDERYAAGRGPQSPSPHPWLVEQAWRVRPGRALDIACGVGRDSIWLARRGFRVHGVDISAVALARASARAREMGVAQRVDFVQADLTRFYFPRAFYDLVVGFSYWEPAIRQALRNAVRPGGYLIYETFNIWWKHMRPDIDDRFLVQPGELRAWLQDWQVLAYREVGSDRPPQVTYRAVSSIVARKPLSPGG